MNATHDSVDGDKMVEAVGQVDGLKDKVVAVGQNIRELGEKAKEAATEKLEDVRDQAKEYYEQGREKATQWEQSMEDYIREQPVKSILIAAGVGAVLALLWKRI